MSGASRRDFLRGGLFRRSPPAPAAPPAAGPAKVIPLLRPPGALPEAEFLPACTRCGECVKACPHDAVRLAGPRFREAAGTPMISPFDAPCRMCADTPCITACAPRALLRRPDGRLPVMGLASIQTFNCLAHVDPALCTGCGVCQHVCPAPVNAVLLLPSRRTPETRPHG